MYFHASPVGNIITLEPRVSNHGIPLVYFSNKRENVLVYLSNAIEKYCNETRFKYNMPCQKWGAYGFNRDGRLRLEEYYPNALEKTYKGVSGYIYRAESVTDSGFTVNIPDAVTSTVPVSVTGSEFIPDAYDEIMKALDEQLVTVIWYNDMPEEMKKWLKKVIPEEYSGAAAHPEYRHFLSGNLSEYL